MCKCLQLSRSIYYYIHTRKDVDLELEEKIKQIFDDNRKVYGSRKIKKALFAENIIVSRRKIGRIMKKLGLISIYTLSHYKHSKKQCNNDETGNLLNREFDGQSPYAAVVSDLTYVRVDNKWHYICILLDLHNREIIGHSVGAKKDASLVHCAFSSIKTSLQKICMFHSDRGNEFKNKLIEDVISTFGIKRSLSNKGCPYDNAVAESTFKIIKTELCFGKKFKDINHLKMEVSQYVFWFNNKRLHGSLNYMSPIQYRKISSSL